VCNEWHLKPAAVRAETVDAAAQGAQKFCHSVDRSSNARQRSSKYVCDQHSSPPFRARAAMEDIKHKKGALSGWVSRSLL